MGAGRGASAAGGRAPGTGAAAVIFGAAGGTAEPAATPTPGAATPAGLGGKVAGLAVGRIPGGTVSILGAAGWAASGTGGRLGATGRTAPGTSAGLPIVAALGCGDAYACVDRSAPLPRGCLAGAGGVEGLAGEPAAPWTPALEGTAGCGAARVGTEESGLTAGTDPASGRCSACEGPALRTAGWGTLGLAGASPAESTA